MMRYSTLFFCVLLAAAAVGRYKAEANVRADRTAIQEIERQMAEERRVIGDLELQLEVLESGPRLAGLAETHLALAPTRSDQLLDADGLARMIAAEVPAERREAPRSNGDFIFDAIAMADFGRSSPSGASLP